MALLPFLNDLLNIINHPSFHLAEGRVGGEGKKEGEGGKGGRQKGGGKHELSFKGNFNPKKCVVRKRELASNGHDAVLQTNK